MQKKGFTVISESANEYTEPNYMVPHESKLLDRDLQQN